MAYSQRHDSNTSPALIATLAGLVVLSFLPGRFTAWASYLSPIVEVPVAPLSGLLRSVSSRDRAATPDQLRQLEDDLEKWRRQCLDAQEEVRQLRQTIADLQQGIALNPDLPVMQASAPVVSASSDLSSAVLVVRGPSAGIDTSAVAITSGLQLVGRVIRVNGPLASVQPITSKAAGRLPVRVMIDERSGQGLFATLTPQGDGTLKGDVEAVSGLEPQIGQTVRLDALDLWPKHARMLVVGKVTAVEPSVDNPQRRVVVVLPNVNVHKLSQVVLRYNGQPPTEGPRP